MTHKKASKSKIFTLLFSFIMCATFISSIAMASLTKTVYAADTTQIDTLGVAFRKVEVGDTLDAAFEFEMLQPKHSKFLWEQTIRQRSYLYQKTGRE